MKILVTGGAGYIGSHIVVELIKGQHQVVVFDNLSTGNYQAVNSKANLVVGDILNKEQLEAVFQKNDFDVVIHLAAKLIVPESVSQPLSYFGNNIQGLVLILEMMKKYQVKNIVFSSTAAVYGNLLKPSLKESELCLPINPYGQTKLAGEWLIQDAAKAHNFNYVIFRYFNVAGADLENHIGQATKNHQPTHLIPLINQAALKIRPHIAIFGDDYQTSDHTCVRDYIHVKDVARAHVLGAKYVFENKSNIFNLGSKQGFSVKSVISEAEKILKLEIPQVIADRRIGDPPILIANVDKVKKELNFEPIFSLAKMIASDYQWQKEGRFKKWWT